MTPTPPEPRTLSDAGEFGLISDITRRLAMPPSVSVGPGDDAAVFLVNGSAVITVDMIVEGHDFRRDWSSPADVGHKAVAGSVADIESMGARPTIMVIGLGAPAGLEYLWVKEFMTGVREEADLAGVALVGGDMATAPQITISVSVVGETAGQAPVLRSGAKPGQVVAVRGRLGWAAAGLAALARGFRSPRAAVDSQRAPKVPYGAGREAAQAGASAMIDVSDGLLADLRHIADASNVGVDLDSARFVIAEPVAAVAAALGRDPLGFVLAGGEDHAMAATFDPGRVPADWDVVGRVVEVDPVAGPRVLVDGHAWEGEHGWQHFR